MARASHRDGAPRRLGSRCFRRGRAARTELGTRASRSLHGLLAPARSDGGSIGRRLDRPARGITTTLEQTETDPGAALVSYVKYLHRIAGRIKLRRNKRAAVWRR